PAGVGLGLLRLLQPLVELDLPGVLERLQVRPCPRRLAGPEGDGLFGVLRRLLPLLLDGPLQAGLAVGAGPPGGQAQDAHDQGGGEATHRSLPRKDPGPHRLLLRSARSFSTSWATSCSSFSSATVLRWASSRARRSSAALTWARAASRSSRL